MEKLSLVDILTGYIQQKLVENQLENRVNVIHLSDHGMLAVRQSNLIDLTQFLENETYEMYGSSPMLQIVPANHGMLESCYSLFIVNNFLGLTQIETWISDVEHRIFTKLSKAAEQNGHFNVYNQKNLPRRWHVNNTRRMGPIIVVADPHYGFQDLFKCKYFITINIIVSILLSLFFHP